MKNMIEYIRKHPRWKVMDGDNATLHWLCKDLQITEISEGYQRVSMKYDDNPLEHGEDFGKVVTLVFTINNTRYTFSRVRKERID